MSFPIYAANNFIKRGTERDIPISNLKLQKLLYLLYTKYVHETGKLLFSDSVEAWQYGPVNVMVYAVCSSDGSNPITEMKSDNNGKTRFLSEAGVFGEVFDFVWSQYSKKSASELIGITHGVDNPNYITAWRRAYDSGGPGTALDEEDIVQDGAEWFGEHE